MDRMKEICLDLVEDPKRSEFIAKLKSLKTVRERIEMIDRALMNHKVKANLSDFPDDQAKRLFYLLQSLGVDLDLCEYYRNFYSRHNRKIHHICRATSDKAMTVCGGNKGKCNKGYFTSRGEPLVKVERLVKRIDWARL